MVVKMKVEENCKRERVNRRTRDRSEEWSDFANDCLLDAYEDKWKCLNYGNFRGRHWQEENCKRDRVNRKRDRREEWSDCVADRLLDAYEDKWKSLNYDNFRSRHWQEVACHVSERGGGDRGSKTSFQCRNKVDQMKKQLKGKRWQRKRVLRWSQYSRLEFILQGSSQRGTNSAGYGIPGGIDAGHVFPLVLGQSSSFSSETGSLAPEESAEEEKWQVQNEEFDIEKEDDHSSDLPLQKLRPAYSLLTTTSQVPSHQSTSTKDRRQKFGNSNKSNLDIVASFQSFANSILKLEEAKLEMHRDSECLLVEGQARQLDLELKRTEMLLDTQLKIMKLLKTQTRKGKFLPRKQDWNPMVSN